MGDESVHLKRSHEETATNVAVEHIKYPDIFTKKKGTEHVNFQGNHQGNLMENAWEDDDDDLSVEMAKIYDNVSNTK